MQLHYLVFDFTDEESGRGSFDAMASVLPERRAALLAEMGTVLQWAWATFGPAGALDDDGEWDYELQGVVEPDTPMSVDYDALNGQIRIEPVPDGSARVTLTITLGGSRTFCEAFEHKFG